ncbi:MAG: hypothetical protein LUE12_03195 [Ruminococcus sp.]|nr:hypothetical protein [Ruminococcus sp.]
MGLFSRRKKADASEQPLKKRIKELKCRKVSFEECDFDELERNMRQDSASILSLKPVNYYAVKNTYISASIYTSTDYRENYVQLRRIDHESVTDTSEIFPLDDVTLEKTLAKVGIIIDLEAARAESE